MSISLFKTHISPEAVAAAGRVLESGWVGQGAKVRAFEAAFAEYLGARFCVAVRSCTAALHLALHVLDLTEGEIITSSLTFVATHHAILYAGCQPVLADIQVSTGNLDPIAMRDKVTEKTRAILLVHYSGYPCDLEEIYEIAKQHRLDVVEDCAHATGATYRGAKIGNSHTLHCFSFGPTKNLTMVHGGAITTNNPQHVERLRRLRCLGIDRDIYRRVHSTSDDRPPWQYEVKELGFAYHLSDLNAAIGLAQLQRLEIENQRRAQIANAYRSGLQGVAGVQLLEYGKDRESSYHMYPILVERRDDLAHKLRRHDIGVGVHYLPNDLLPKYKYGDLPHWEYFWQRTLTLPIHPTLTDDEVDTVIGLVRAGW